MVATERGQSGEAVGKGEESVAAGGARRIRTREPAPCMAATKSMRSAGISLKEGVVDAARGSGGCQGSRRQINAFVSSPDWFGYLLCMLVASKEHNFIAL